MTLEKKLVRLRKKEGMSQADVSEKLNVSRQAVSRWEAGDSRPSIENLQALCKLYNVKLDDLLDESNEEVPIEKPECQKVEIEERRASGKFDFDIPAKTLMKASSSFPMEYGETVTITASYTPASASMDFGLIDSDGTFYPVRANNGSINQTIRIDLRGNYTFAIRNNSSYTVNVFGFVNY